MLLWKKLLTNMSMPFSLVGVASSSSATINLPAGGQAGDLVLVYVAKSNDSDRVPPATAALVTTSGYTQLETATANLVANSLYAKVLTTAETSVAMNLYSVGFALVFRGASAAVLRSVQGETFGGVNTPSLTPSRAGSIVLTLGVSSVMNETADLSAAPSGYSSTEIITNGSGLGIWFPSVGIARKTWESGAEDPGAWSYTAGGTMYSMGYTVAVQPA